MMVWIITIAIVVFIIYKVTHSNNSYSSSSTRTTTTYSTPTPRPAPRADTLEEQSIYTCLARFYGAINAIRDTNNHRSSIQRGHYSICKKEDGTYMVAGGYDHDSDYRVEDALRHGGYLQYYGLSYVSEGMTYRVDGIREESIKTNDGQDFFCCEHYLNIVMNKLRDNLSGIIITNANVSPHMLSIDFKFSD